MAYDNGPGPMPRVPRPARINKVKAETVDVLPPSPGALMLAQYEKYGRKLTPPPPKKSLTVRIGVFFDGTGNSVENTTLGLLCGAHHRVTAQDLDASCKPYMADPQSSYGNDVTNIVKLHDRYEAPDLPLGEGLNKTALRKIYIEGIGTHSGQPDSTLGLGTGRGESGVAARVNKAFARSRSRSTN